MSLAPNISLLATRIGQVVKPLLYLPAAPATDGTYSINRTGGVYSWVAAGSVVTSTTTVDLGDVGSDGGTFIVADPAALLTSVVSAKIGAPFPDGRDADEMEMDGVQVFAACLTAGELTFTLTANPGPIHGQYKIEYQLS